MKHYKILILIVISIMLLTGCAEDTFALEKNLYYDMEDIRRNALNFMDESIDALATGNYSTPELQKPIDKMKEKVANLNAPKHLKQEVSDWQEEVDNLILIFEAMAEGDMSVVKEIDGEVIDFEMMRIYDGFKAYERE